MALNGDSNPLDHACDINGDGAVDAVDVQTVINAVLEIGPSDGCDVNGALAAE